MNPNTNKYIRTDLACECIDPSQKIPDGVEHKEERDGDILILRTEIKTDEQARLIGKKTGSYRTLECKKLSELCDSEAEKLSRLIARELCALAEKTCKKPSAELRVLVAGLGNRNMTPDALGPEVLSRLTVTGHIASLDSGLFAELGACELYAVAPGVLGDTGIESLELIRGAKNAVKPDLIIAVDALASRSAERLCATVQMSDCGISPGSGVGNKRKEISRETLGVPVIALGVPTVIDTSTLVFDVLMRTGGEKEDIELILREISSFFVAPREADGITRRAACIFADAIDMAFGIKRSESEYILK